MPTPTIADYLKYANLQMAAEAFLYDEATRSVKAGQQLIDALKTGNDHASKFTATQSTDFTNQWEVVAQQANTSTGFSGTLFRNKANTNELVVSFRSTEFIDDAVRDNAATNTLEIKDTGWAWGQISDMEDWYKSLNATGGLLEGKQFAVTGYSLGGHLATAFNLLRGEDGTRDRITNVVTFNGAGVGKVTQGTLTSALKNFNDLRADPAAIKAALNISVPELSACYELIHDGLKSGAWTIQQAQDALDDLSLPISRGADEIARLAKEKQPIAKALAVIKDLQTEVERLQTLQEGGSGPNATRKPNAVPDTQIQAENFDYRLAVALAAKRTEAATLFNGIAQAASGKQYLAPKLSNQYDVMGDTMPSAISNSQWHYGTEVRISIEDQPLYRGGIGKDVLGAALDYGDIKLLVSGYATKDFGDTHSLVLLIDSLNTQNAIFQLLANDAKAKAPATLKETFSAASNLRKVNGAIIFGTDQGKAEGDALENEVNALSDLLLGPRKQPILKGSSEGNTWANIGNDGNFTGRATFYQNLSEIAKAQSYLTLTTQGDRPRFFTEKPSICSLPSVNSSILI